MPIAKHDYIRCYFMFTSVLRKNKSCFSSFFSMHDSNDWNKSKYRHNFYVWTSVTCNFSQCELWSNQLSMCFVSGTFDRLKKIINYGNKDLNISVANLIESKLIFNACGWLLSTYQLSPNRNSISYRRVELCLSLQQPNRNLTQIYTTSICASLKLIPHHEKPTRKENRILTFWPHARLPLVKL